MKNLFRAEYGQIGGVCKGLSNYCDIDESIMRIIFIILFFTPFPIVLTYLFMWIIIPKENNNYEDYNQDDNTKNH
jgi:phage shock protein C